MHVWWQELNMEIAFPLMIGNASLHTFEFRKNDLLWTPNLKTVEMNFPKKFSKH